MLLRCTFLGSFLLAAVMAAPSFGTTVIGSFTGGVAENGWGRWNDPDGGFNNGLPGTTTSVSNESSTDGDGWSARIEHDGNQQTLAYSAGVAGTISDFMANNFLVFDLVYAGLATDQGSGGFNELWEVVMNSQFGGFTGIGGACGSCQAANPGTANFVGFGPGDQAPVVIENVTLDYRHIKDTWGANTPDWIELIFAVQGSNRDVKYIDNVRLVIPEPTSLALFGMSLAGLALVRRCRDTN